MAFILANNNNIRKQNLEIMKLKNKTLPNFFIVGAQKAGTTTLYHYLKQHPEIYMSPIKEPMYFALNNLIYNSPGSKTDRYFRFNTIDNYSTLFQGVKTEKAIGEASTIYLYDGNTPHRIKELIPNAKIIIMLRNPVDRAYSNFYHAVRNGRETTDSFIEALQREDDRVNNNWSPLYHYKRKGFYFEQIKRYYDSFGPEKIKIYLFENFIINPEPICKDIFGFLGVDQSFIPDISTKYNESGYPKSKLIKMLRTYVFNSILLKFFLVKQTLPVHYRIGIKDFIVNKALNWSLAKPPEIPEEIRSELSEAYENDILKLQNLIQQDLSIWKYS